MKPPFQKPECHIRRLFCYSGQLQMHCTSNHLFVRPSVSIESFICPPIGVAFCLKYRRWFFSLSRPALFVLYSILFRGRFSIQAFEFFCQFFETTSQKKSFIKCVIFKYLECNAFLSNLDSELYCGVGGWYITPLRHFIEFWMLGVCGGGRRRRLDIHLYHRGYNQVQFPIIHSHDHVSCY